MSGSKASTSRGHAIWVRRLPRPLRARHAPLLPHRRRAGDAGHRLHVGRVRAPHERRAARQLGQPRQPDARERAPELRRRARAGRADRGGPQRFSTRSRARSTRVGELIENARFKAALAEAMATSALANQYLAEQAPWALVKTDRERAATVLYVALRARRLAEDALHAVPAVHVAGRCTSCSATRATIAGPLEIRTETEDDGSTHEVLTGDYASWVGSLGSRASCPPGRRSASRSRSSASSRRRPPPRSSHACRRDRHARAPGRARRSRRRARARRAQAGVTRIVTVGTDLPECRRALELAERHEGVFAVLGIHPHEAGTATDEDVAALRELLAHPKAVGVGETGLDWFRDYAPHDAQTAPLRAAARRRSGDSASRS